jgi:nitrogen fixation/metabolism regulation signal transduction histidine kinase
LIAKNQGCLSSLPPRNLLKEAEIIAITVIVTALAITATTVTAIALATTIVIIVIIVIIVTVTALAIIAIAQEKEQLPKRIRMLARIFMLFCLVQVPDLVKIIDASTIVRIVNHVKTAEIVLLLKNKK